MFLTKWKEQFGQPNKKVPPKRPFAFLPNKQTRRSDRIPNFKTTKGKTHILRTGDFFVRVHETIVRIQKIIALFSRVNCMDYSLTCNQTWN